MPTESLFLHEYKKFKNQISQHVGIDRHAGRSYLCPLFILSLNQDQYHEQIFIINDYHFLRDNS